VVTGPPSGADMSGFNKYRDGKLPRTSFPGDGQHVTPERNRSSATGCPAHGHTHVCLDVVRPLTVPLFLRQWLADEQELGAGNRRHPLSSAGM